MFAYNKTRAYCDKGHLFFWTCQYMLILLDVPLRCLSFSKTCVKWPRKIEKKKILRTNSSLMKVKSTAECYFHMHKVIIGLKNQFWTF